MCVCTSLCSHDKSLTRSINACESAALFWGLCVVFTDVVSVCAVEVLQEAVLTLRVSGQKTPAGPGVQLARSQQTTLKRGLKQVNISYCIIRKH